MKITDFGIKTILSVPTYIFAAIVFLLVGATIPNQKVLAITAPDGGNSFETAEPLTEGEYSNTPIPAETDFYYAIEVPVGYELVIDYQYIEDTYYGTTTLYSDSREELVADDQSGGTLQWLNGNNAVSETNYFLVMSNWHELDGFTLTVTLTERNDADSGKDAGDSFDDAISLDYGTHEGYISSFVFGPDGGNDSLDFYKLPVESGDTITFRVTPDGLNTSGLALYDENRSELYLNDGLDLTPGEILQTSLDIEEDGYIYASVQWPMFNSGDTYIFKYSMLVTTDAVDDLGGTGTADDDTDDGDTDTDDGAGDTTAGGMSTGLKTLLIIGFLFVLFILFIIAVVLIIKALSKKSAPKEEPATAPVESKPTEPSVDVNPEDKTEAKPDAQESIISPAPKEASKANASDGDSKVSITVQEGTKVEVNTVPGEDNTSTDDNDGIGKDK